MKTPKNLITFFSVALLTLVSVAPGSEGPVVKTSLHDSKPVLLTMSMPVLPETLAEVTGKVVISCSIDEQGKTRHLKVEESSNPHLNEVALRMVSAWVYQPAVKNGRAVSVEVLLPISFI